MTEHSEATLSEPSVRDRLLAAHRSGGLLAGISEILRVGGLRADAVAEELVILHNDGTIDVVEAFSRLDKREDGFSFFQTRSVFERALPHIDADVITTIRTVRHLVNQAGDDLAAGFTLRSLESFLAREPARPSSALSEIQAHPELHDLVPTALLAGWQIDPETYVQEALDLTSAENPDMRRQAVFALGRIQWSDKNRPPAAAYAALERIVGQEADDKLLAVTATTAAHLLEQDPAHTELLIGLIDGAIEKGGDHATHAAARLLAEEATPDALVLRLLAHIRRVNPQHKGTVGQIDDALSRLLVRGKADVTLEALTGMLKEGVLEPDALGSVLHVLRSQKTLVSKAVTKWLLDGDPPVCRMAAMLVGDARGMDLPCEVDVAEIDMTDSRAVVFLARKVCGYFFMNPLTGVRQWMGTRG